MWPALWVAPPPYGGGIMHHEDALVSLLECWSIVRR
jgi:hypothetical protein